MGTAEPIAGTAKSIAVAAEPIAGAAVGWLHFTALIALWGAVSSRWFIVPEAPAGVRRTLVATARRVGVLAGAVLVAAMGLVFWCQLADFHDPFVPWRQDAALLLTTDWGRTWMLGAMGAVLTPWPILAASRATEGGAKRKALWIAATGTRDRPARDPGHGPAGTNPACGHGRIAGEHRMKPDGREAGEAAQAGG